MSLRQTQTKEQANHLKYLYGLTVRTTPVFIHAHEHFTERTNCLCVINELPGSRPPTNNH